METNAGSKAMEGKSLTPLNKYNFYLLKDCFEQNWTLLFGNGIN